MNNDSSRYYDVVKTKKPPKYETPEEQGTNIKKCTILTPTREIGYRNYSAENIVKNNK